MTTVGVMTAVMECRCVVDEVVCDIEVFLHETTHEGTAYHAVAFFSSASAIQRMAVVNERGMPLVAVGRTPGKAAAFMASALRRRYGRDVRSRIVA